MKILYISGDIGVEVGGRKGASTHVRETCHALQRYGHQIRILTPTPGNLDNVLVPVVRVPAPTAKWLGSDTRYMLLNRRMRRALLREINNFQPDAIYERYSLYQTAGLEVATRLGIPRILEVNTLLAREQTNRLHFPKFATKIEQNLWRRERALICVSETLRDLMTEAAGLDRKNMIGFEISPVAVDPETFHPSIEPAPEVLALKSKGQKVAGYAGTLTAWHGVDLFFEAARLLRDRNIPILILAVGGEDERVERLRQRAAEEGLADNLNFYGSIDHGRVPSFLSAMDMCLIADTQDWSSPTKFFEFAAMEKPIIASRSPSVTEVFGGNSKAGFFFTRGDAPGMVSCMEEVLANTEMAASYGKAARERVLARYTWECNIKTIMDLYHKQGVDTATFPAAACPTPTPIAVSKSPDEITAGPQP